VFVLIFKKNWGSYFSNLPKYYPKQFFVQIKYWCRIIVHHGHQMNHSSDNWLWFVGCLNCDSSDYMMDYDSAVVCYLNQIRFWGVVCIVSIIRNIFCADKVLMPNHSPSWPSDESQFRQLTLIRWLSELWFVWLYDGLWFGCCLLFGWDMILRRCL